MAFKRTRLGVPGGVAGGITTPPPARPTQIFQAPAGLLDFLGTKTVGHNPDLLNQVVSSSLEMTPFYLAGQETKRQFVSLFNPGIGTLANVFIVPDGKAWIPLYQAVTCLGGGAAGTIAARPALYDPNGSLLYTTSASISAASVVSGRQLAVAIDWYQNMVIVPPGFRFGIFNELSTPDPANQVNVSLTYVELLV